MSVQISRNDCKPKLSVVTHLNCTLLYTHIVYITEEADKWWEQDLTQAP